MRIGLIGCGKVGTTLFSLLGKNNRIVGIDDINKKNKQRALQLLHIKKNPEFRELVNNSEALFFATPDDQLVKAFTKARPYFHGEKYIFHFSGLLPASIFPRLRNIYRGSVHPFATFPTIVIPPKKKYFLFIEGDRKAMKAARKIFRSRYLAIRSIAKKRKAYYHLTGVFASNLLVGLLSSAYTLARKTGWKEKDFYEVVFSIVEETLKNTKKYTLENALSGPLRRGDVAVIKKHIHTLKKDKDLLNIYRAVSLYMLSNFPGCRRKKEITNLLKKI